MKCKVFLMIIVLAFFFSPSLKAYEPIVQTHMLTSFLSENFHMIKDVLKISHNMQYEAQPFMSRRHREKFRFEPNSKNPRKVMTLSRQIAARFKLVDGILSHASVPNKKLLFEEIFDSTSMINTYGKRATRAIQDNNYMLYLAASKGIKKEVFHLNSLLDSLEKAINSDISETDAMKENL